MKMKIKDSHLEKKKKDAQIRCSTEVACAQGRTMEELFQYDVSYTLNLLIKI